MFLFNLFPSGIKEQIKNRLFNVVNQTPSLNELKNSVNSINIGLSQLREAMQIYNRIYIPPPENIQRRIVGGYFDDFIRSGYRNLDDFEIALAKQGKKISDFNTVLDFGCGCGRIFMPLHRRFPGLKIYGSDIDSEAIEYCNSYLSPVGEFKVNNHEAPSPFNDNQFDLVYGVSVFTHLPEDMQFGWLKDLHRITKPGAYLLLSVENEKSRVILKGKQIEEFDKKGFFFFEGPLTESLPEFYRTSLHTHEYVKREWSKYFEILDIIPKGMMNHQDLVVCRKREKE